MLGKPTNSNSAVCFNIVQTGGNFEGNGQRWFGCPIEPKKCLKSIYDKTQILCRPRKSRSIESIWYGPYILTPYIISQCENHTIQERKCLPTFILAIIVNFNGFEETIADFQWFLRRPSPLNVFWLSDHCHQWFFNGFWFCYHRFQWFSMVPDHWSNNAMVSLDRHGLLVGEFSGENCWLLLKSSPDLFPRSGQFQ